MATLTESLHRFRADLARRVERDPGFRIVGIEASALPEADGTVTALCYADTSAGDCIVTTCTVPAGAPFDRAATESRVHFCRLRGRLCPARRADAAWPE